MVVSPGPAQAQAFSGGPTVARAQERQLGVALTRHQRSAMTVLTSWGAASVGAGAALMASAPDDDFLFWGGVQHLSWGLVNILIGASSLHSARPAVLDEPHAPDHWRRRQQRMPRGFWINAALDVLYVASGALMWGLLKPEGGRGSGAAIVGQGGFLLGFDIIAALTVP